MKRQEKKTELSMLLVSVPSCTAEVLVGPDNIFYKIFSMKLISKLLLLCLLWSTLQVQAQNTGIDTKVSNSTLTDNGSYAGAYRAVSANSTLSAADQFINVTAASTITLPDAVVSNAATDAFYGRIYHIRNTSVGNVTIAGFGSQLIQISSGTTANTVVLKSGESVDIVKNNNNTAGQALWEIFQQFAASSDNSFSVGELKYLRVTVPTEFALNTPTEKKVMTGKSSSQTGTTTWQAAYDLAGAQQANFLVINGLRMDFMCPSTVLISPKLFNTTTSNVTYHVAAMTTVAANNNNSGTNVTIAPGYFSYYIYGTDKMQISGITYSEYISVMITFNDGQWYNCTWHATREYPNHSFQLYFTAQRLN